MAYPEPIPELRGKHAKEFLGRLEGFQLPASMKKFYAGAREQFRRSQKKRTE
ncbi:MAG TPA: hypothetical protein VI893_06860 [Thermoplasmata archaeon]|nr:hypothetical protein [Thermoplasmata archaeon]